MAHAADAWRASTRARRRTPGCAARRRARSSPTAAASAPATPSSPGPATPATAARYVGAALAAGASACLVEADGVEAFGFDDEPRVAALRGLKAAAGDIASRFLGDAERAARRRRRHRHQRQDLDRVVDRAGAGALGRRCGVVGTLGIGEPPRRRRCRPRGASRVDRPDDARSGRRCRARCATSSSAASPPARSRRRRSASPSTASPARRVAVARVHQLHPGPPRLPRRHGRLLAGQGAAVRLAGPARRGRQPRRRARARARRRARRRGRSTCWTVSIRGATARLRADAHPPRRATASPSTSSKATTRAPMRDAADRRLQRRQPARRDRRAARARRRRSPTRPRRARR